MSKKNTKKTIIEATVNEKNIEESLVFVRVVRNFKDATDNNNPISAGANTFYRTNVERAAKLVEAGFCEYVDVEVSNIHIDSETEESDVQVTENDTPETDKNDDDNDSLDSEDHDPNTNSDTDDSNDPNE